MNSSEALGTFINSKHTGTYGDFGVLRLMSNYYHKVEAVRTH